MTRRVEGAMNKRVRGHTLRYEGRVSTPFGYGGTGEGSGECACGEKSPVLPTTAARQRWHREHKAAVLESQGDGQ